MGHAGVVSSSAKDTVPCSAPTSRPLTKPQDTMSIPKSGSMMVLSCLSTAVFSAATCPSQRHQLYSSHPTNLDAYVYAIIIIIEWPCTHSPPVHHPLRLGLLPRRPHYRCTTRCVHVVCIGKRHLCCHPSSSCCCCWRSCCWSDASVASGGGCGVGGGSPSSKKRSDSGPRMRWEARSSREREKKGCTDIYSIPVPVAVAAAAVDAHRPETIPDRA